MSLKKPVELYRFNEGSLVNTLTSAAYNVTHNDEVYLPASISRNQIESKNELTRANLDVTVPLSNVIAQRYYSGAVDTVVGLSIFTVDQYDGATTVFWKGRLASVNVGGSNAVLSFESVFTSLRRPGLRARWQRSCRHALYGRGCTLNPEDFRFNTTVVSAEAATVVVSSVGGAPTNRYKGGMIRASNGTVRFIAQQIGTTLTLSKTFEQLITDIQVGAYGYGNNYGGNYGDVGVGIYPGCNHNLYDCINVFDNLPNYGGFPWIPTKNPMGGISIV